MLNRRLTLISACVQKICAPAAVLKSSSGEIKMQKTISLFSTIGLALLVSASSTCWGWGPKPIQDVIDAPTASAKPLTMAEVKSAIVSAGVKLGWQMAETSPGVIRGTLHLRKHTAVVEVSYSTLKYSIVYQSSVNLDAHDGKIHRNYNSWIQNLQRGIDAALPR